MPKYLRLLCAFAILSTLLFIGFDLIKVANRAQIISELNYAYLLFAISVVIILFFVICIPLLKKKQRK